MKFSEMRLSSNDGAAPNTSTSRAPGGNGGIATDWCSTDSGPGTAMLKSGSADGDAMVDGAKGMDTVSADLVDAIAASSSSGSSRAAGVDARQVEERIDGEGKAQKHLDPGVKNAAGESDSENGCDLLVSSIEDSMYICGAPTARGTVCRSKNLTSLGWCAAHTHTEDGVVKELIAKKPAPVCGAMTQKGWPCRNPYLTHLGLCAYHSVVDVPTAPNGVVHSRDASPTQSGVAVASAATPARMALSAPTRTGDRGKDMGARAGTGVGDMKISRNKGSARVCGARTQKILSVAIPTLRGLDYVLCIRTGLRRHVQTEVLASMRDLSWRGSRGWVITRIKAWAAFILRAKESLCNYAGPSPKKELLVETRSLLDLGTVPLTRSS